MTANMTANSMMTIVRDSRLDQNELQNSTLKMNLEQDFMVGWKKEVIAISFDAIQPTEILLDPLFGVRINYTRLESE
jgi:hypothetical protein